MEIPQLLPNLSTLGGCSSSENSQVKKMKVDLESPFSALWILKNPVSVVILEKTVIRVRSLLRLTLDFRTEIGDAHV